MSNKEKTYKCVHCGKLLPFSKVWCCDNKTNMGVCYNKECIAKENQKLEHDLEYTPTQLSWEQLFNQGGA